MEDSCSMGIRNPDGHLPEVAVENPFIEPVSSERVRNESSQSSGESVDRTRGPIISRPFGVPKGNTSRMSRLSLSGTRFIFNLTRYVVGGYGFLVGNGLNYIRLADIIIAICIVFWDFVELTGSNGDGTYSRLSTVSVVVEAVITPGIIVLMSIEVAFEQGDQFGIVDYTEMLGSLLWLPILILSAILLYRAVKNYVQKRNAHESWPVIAFAQTGGLVAVIPILQPTFDSASRLSVDSLVQAQGV